MPCPSHLWPYDDTEKKIHLAQSGLTNIPLVNEKKNYKSHTHVNTHAYALTDTDGSTDKHEHPHTNTHTYSQHIHTYTHIPSFHLIS